jgi:hypothetical protein
VFPRRAGGLRGHGDSNFRERGCRLVKQFDLMLRERGRLLDRVLQPVNQKFCPPGRFLGYYKLRLPYNDSEGTK